MSINFEFIKPYTLGTIVSLALSTPQPPPTTHAWRYALIDYGTSITTALESFIASHYDLLDFDWGLYNETWAQNMKAANPNIKLIGYRDAMWTSPTYNPSEWATINANESWFLHTSSGTRVQRSDGEYAMNIASSGWRNFLANMCTTRLSAYPTADGIFLDNVAEAVFLTWNPFTVPVSTIPDPVTGTGNVATNWNTYMIGLIQTVKTAMGSKLLIINTFNNATFVQYCDGQTKEHFFHSTSDAPTVWTYHDDPLSELAEIEQLCATGKYIITVSGGIVDPTNAAQVAQMNAVALYCLCGFLLSYSGAAAFGCQTMPDGQGYSLDAANIYYWSFEDSARNIGTPVGARYNVQGSLWARNFTSGRVFFNGSDTTSYTVTVGSTNYTVPPRSGLIVPT